MSQGQQASQDGLTDLGMQMQGYKEQSQHGCCNPTQSSNSESVKIR